MNQKTTIGDLALVGAGYWGKNLARNFHTLGCLQTICDARTATLRTFQSEYDGVRKTTEMKAVLEDDTITKVAIAAPATLHYEIAKAALLAGKDVYVEKPLCLDEAEAQELVDLALEKSRILMVGHLLQYHPCILKLQALLAQGELGKLHYIASNRLNLGKIRQEENALWSFAPHDISVILSLAGHQMPEQVRCVGGSYLSHDVADTTLTILRFADGVRAHIYVNWLNPFKEQKLTVVGSTGMVVFDDTRPWSEKLLLHRHYLTWADGQTPIPSKKPGEPILVEETEPLRNECLHFLECCSNRRPPRTDGHEGLRVLSVLQMAQRSLDQDGEAVRPENGRQQAEDRGRKTDDRGQTAENSGGKTVPSSVVISPAPDYFVHPTAVVDEGAMIGKGTKVWHFSHVMKGAQIGERCILGQNVNVDGGTVVGHNVKIQNNVSIYTGSVIEDDVFLGPSCVLTNVSNPRSQVNRHRLYEKTLIMRGATIGANATIVCGVTIGRYAFIAAGAVVTRDVADYALVMGNPARQKGWMSRHGHPLKPGAEGIMTCPESGFRYRLYENAIAQSAESRHSSAPTLRCLDLDEEKALPVDLAVGRIGYGSLKEARTASD